MSKNPFSKTKTPSSSVPNTSESQSKPKRKWVILPFFWKLLKGLCFSLGFAVLISLITTTLFITSLGTTPQLADLPEKGVLYLEFKDELRETPKQGGITDAFSGKQPTVREFVTAIDAAATDPQIHGIAARMYNGGFGLVHVQEIREALQRFKASGKFTKIYSTSYGGGGGGTGRFYLASVFEERWMQPLGVVGITGVRAEVPFVKSLLDKIGISPQFYQKKEYKTAYESLTRDEISPQNKQIIQDIVDSAQTQIMNDIPRDLNMSKQQFQTLVDRGLLTSDEAFVSGLITHKDYVDIMVTQIEKEILGDAYNAAKPQENEQVFVALQSYIAHQKSKKTKAAKEKAKQNKESKSKIKGAEVALIYAHGVIASTNGESYAKDGIAAAEVIAPAIMNAAYDENIKTIILRVDSPGGSPAASETILHAVQIAKDKGKKVVVSMGTVAASGGYWISAYADRIFALPTTITGSIGVLGGKIAVPEVWEKLGVNWNMDIQWGENAGMWSVNSKFSESEAERINAMLDHVYDSFIDRVAKGRGMTPEQVDAVAKGRVWTGAQALRVGLVDEMGGLYDVMNYVAKDLGKESPSDLNITILPKPKTVQEQIIQLLTDSGMVYSGLKLQGSVMQGLKPFADEVSIFTPRQGIQTIERLEFK